MNTYDERIRVLYAEDDRDSFDMLRMSLSLSGIDLEPARSIADALTRAGEERFDLYLLDSGLPDGSGISLCRTLRAVDPKIPVIFYSGSAYPDEIKMGMDAGAGAYLTKPNSDKLAETIIQFVVNSRGKVFPFASGMVMTAEGSSAARI